MKSESAAAPSSSDLSLQDIDFVPSSQPFEDGEEDSFWLGQYAGTTDSAEGSVVDFVPSSQPLEDGEMCQGLMTPAKEMYLGFYCEQSTETRRPRLVRRASPVKPRPAGASPATNMISATPIPRSSKLVRHVTIAPNLERHRRRTCEEAGRIVKKIGLLTKTTARLRRKHRQLLQFITSTTVDKENVFMF
ncbi:hypothetical protein MVEN_01149800 [Mycena venus]|uniref:Uncharacterized protein n=1 Tax=Mycena venus TaxID=2733690 RepID=A0A8H7CXK3_9AGAR|nr:hypothetical protein MVEN_01149800 [Mycena venus]